MLNDSVEQLRKDLVLVVGDLNRRVGVGAVDGEMLAVWREVAEPVNPAVVDPNAAA